MFDPKKAAFYLIAAVIAVQLVLVAAGVVACIYAGLEGMNVAKCSEAKFGDVLASALAVGMALYVSGKKDE